MRYYGILWNTMGYYGILWDTLGFVLLVRLEFLLPFELWDCFGIFLSCHHLTIAGYKIGVPSILFFNYSRKCELFMNKYCDNYSMDEVINY